MVESIPSKKLIVVAFVSDLMVAVRIRKIVESLGFQLQVVDGKIQGGNNSIMEINPLDAEPIHGPEAALFDKLTRWSPVLIIIDLGDEGVAWRHWLMRLKSSPATRRRPVVCFGPHVHTEVLEEAKNLAADYVVSRSRFFSNMPSIVSKFGTEEISSQISDSCQDGLPNSASTGLDAFNRGDYFDAHEHLEDAWNADSSAGRDFYRALIQIAVAYLQIERSNYRGAYKMILRSRQWFRSLPDICRGVDVKTLYDDAEVVFQTLLLLGPDGIGEFDRTLLKPIRLVGHE